MTADEHDLVGEVGAAQVADDVGGARLRQVTRGDAHAHGDLAAARDLALEHVGVRVGDGDRGDARRGDVVGQRAGVRDAVGAGADGADDDAHGARRAGDGGPLGARAHGLAVAAAVAGALGAPREEHDLALHGAGRQALQRGDILDHHDGGDEALVGGADAAADRDRDHRLRERRDHLGARFAAHPARHDDLGGAHVGEAEVDELAARPLDAREVAGRAGEARSDLGGEGGEDLQRFVAGERTVAQLGCGLERGLGGLDGFDGGRGLRGGLAIRRARRPGERRQRHRGDERAGQGAREPSPRGSGPAHHARRCLRAASSARSAAGVRLP